MSFLDKVTNLLPFGKKEEEKEYFFALNIGRQNLEAALWVLAGKDLQVLQNATSKFSSLSEITRITDKLLDNVLGTLNCEPQKILFGVPDLWLTEDDLKEEYLRLLRSLVKDLELSPMAYVATSHAIIHFLETKEGIPPTTILVGFEEDDSVITVSRAGKLDGSKVIKRSDNLGLDIEKALLTFTSVETLPSKILIYGKERQKLEKIKGELLSFAWMSKLSFLHFPKIDILDEDLEIKSVCLAGAKEINPDASFVSYHSIPQSASKQVAETFEDEKPKEEEDLGFVVGDVSKRQRKFEEIAAEQEREIEESLVKEALEAEDFEEIQGKREKFTALFKKALSYLMHFRPRFSFRNMPLWVGLAVLIALSASYLVFPKAYVKIFVEPQVLEKDAEVIADPKAREIDEQARVIPGQIVETEISGSGKGDATGKKEIGDLSKGTVILFNKTYESKTLSKGTVLISSDGLKFTLDLSVSIASQSATDTGVTFGKANAQVSAQAVGADGNLPSGTSFTIASVSSAQVSAKAEGNFSGGTSKQAKVVSEADQNRLLAQVALDLRRQAQQKLQETLKDKKVLEEALDEEIVKKSFSKNINDQTDNFSLNLMVRYKGTAFDDKDLKLIVSKLVTTEIPEGFELNFEETETQADVSKLEKDGKLVFLARFRAKLIPKLDLEKFKKEIKGRTPSNVAQILKGKDHILGSDIIITPKLPSFLQLVPFLEKNIKVEVGLK